MAQHEPDVVVLDISLPGHDGLEGLAELRRQFPGQRVVMLSMYDEERYAVSALRAGAAGYITKAMAAEELVKAIRQVVARRHLHRAAPGRTDGAPGARSGAAAVAPQPDRARRRRSSR